jgi:DNA-binding NarL/FixJ family response regulator
MTASWTLTTTDPLHGTRCDKPVADEDIVIKILLVDDQPSVRRGLRMRLALEPDVTVVGEADDGARALDLVSELHPDVVVMDLEMPGMDGMAATAALHSSSAGPPVVILSLYDDAETRKQALSAGAVGFVGKCEAGQALLAAIRQAVPQA